MAANTYTVTGTGFPTGGGVKTLDGTLADTVTITPLNSYWQVEVHNVGSAVIDIRCDGEAAVAAAEFTVRVPAGESVSFPSAYLKVGTMSVVGNGNTYAVNLIPGAR